jgi:hypothetical protein
MRTLLGIWTVISLTPVTAIAQTAEDAVRRCHAYAASESADPGRAIAGCTSVIESAQSGRDQKLDALAARAGDRRWGRVVALRAWHCTEDKWRHGGR